MIQWKFLKLVLVCLAITAFIYLVYTAFLSAKATAATMSFMPIVIKSAIVTCSVICTAVVLGLIGLAIYGALAKPFEVTKAEQSGQKVTFDDVIVLDEIKEKLRMICDDISQERKAMLEKVGFKPPQGYLLHGPPGNGKTLLARAVANEANLSFFSISGADIISLFVGQGAQNVRNLFQTARKNSPCVIFIDEIDTIGKRRTGFSGNGKKSNTEILNQLLTEMDGFNSNKGVIVIAATNRRDILDEALLRPVRFSEHIHIPLPESSLREKILDLYMKNVPIASDLNLKGIAEKTEGYSGAELSNLVNEAKYNAVRRTQEQKIEKLTVGMGDFTKALETLNSKSKQLKDERANNRSIIEQPILEMLQQHLAGA